MKNRNRDSSIELLRILAMLMIIGLHYFNGSMGGALACVQVGSFNYYITHILETLFIVAVNLFVLISGFFMISQGNSITLRKVADLYLLTVFYDLFFYLLGLIIGKCSWSYGELIGMMFPFSKGARWFVKTYIILLLVSPYMNQLLNNLKKRNYEILLVIQVVFFSIWPSFLNGAPINDAGYGIVHFITLYLIGAYIRLFVYKEKKELKNIIIYLFGYVACAIISYFLRHYDRAWNYDFIFNVLGATSLFLFFVYLKIKTSRFVNFVSSTTFGIYLIHTDRSIRDFLWMDVFKCNQFYDSNWFILHIVFVVISMFVILAGIDWIRQVLWKQSISKILYNVKILDFRVSAESNND